MNGGRMAETLILVLLFVLWFWLRPKRDFYVVEYRTCFDEKFCSIAFPSPVYGFDELSLSTHSLIICDKGPNGAALFDKDGVRKINITQIVFDELAAALLYFE